MKLKLSLLLLCLLGIGIFGHAQSRKKEPKPKVENGPDAIPVTVTSTKHPKKPAVPLGKDGKPLPPPKIKGKYLKAPAKPAKKTGNS